MKTKTVVFNKKKSKTFYFIHRIAHDRLYRKHFMSKDCVIHKKKSSYVLKSENNWQPADFVHLHSRACEKFY